MFTLKQRKKDTHAQTHIMSGDRRKIASKDSKPRQRLKLTETEREIKKRKKNQLQH